MAVLTPQTTSVLGTTITLVAANAGGDSFPVTGVISVIVRNADASSKTVTVVRPNTTFGQADPDIPVVVAAGATAVIGPIPSEFVNTGTANVDLTYSAVTSVTVAVIRTL